MEEVEPFTQGSTVEVSSDDVGFHGAWYVATLLDLAAATPTKGRPSNKKKKKSTGYLVKYATLYQETNFTEPLTEVVDPSYVRPLPPRYPRRNNDNDNQEEVAGDFQVYDVVDAYLRDGWWIGVVSKVIIDGEIKKYLVSFESPPEEVEFEGSQMRLHVDWIDSRWQLRPQKRVTEESNNGAHSGFITPPKGASMTKSAKKKRSSRKIAVTVGLVAGTVTYKRAKRIVNLGEEEEDLHENLQSSEGVENSVLQSTMLQNEEMKVGGYNKQVNERSKGNTEDSLGLDQEIIIKDGNNQQKRKRGRPRKSESQSPNGSLEDNQEGRKRDSSGIHEITTELDEQPLAVWYQGINPLPIFNKSTCSTTLDHDEPFTPAMVNEGQNTENQHEWPFIKRSPIWATIESLEIYQNIPQTPHFSPLCEIKEDCREGLAIAHMVTFANVVQRTANLQWTDPNHVIENSLETLVDLEANGFNVGPLRARLNEILAKKDEAGRLESEMKEAEKEVDTCNREKTAIDKEINVIKRKMRELEEEMVKAVAMKNVKDEEAMVARSKLQVVSSRIAGWKLGFEELVGSPL